MPLSNIKIVLVEPSHPGNIGASARAMKTMCLTNLALVTPRHFPSAEASARSAGADDVLANCRVYATLGEALSDCQLVIGCSARQRAINCVLLDARKAGQLVAQTGEHVSIALVFGREHSGLTNAEMDKCHYLLHIAANPCYQSLNLAAAVQIVAYEIQMAQVQRMGLGTEREDESTATLLATSLQTESMYQHIEVVLRDIEFMRLPRSAKLMRKLRRIFDRAHLNVEEVNIIRGIMSAAQGKKYRWQIQVGEKRLDK